MKGELKKSRQTLNNIINVYHNSNFKSPPTFKQFYIICGKENILKGTVYYYFNKLKRNGLQFSKDVSNMERLNSLFKEIKKYKITTSGELFEKLKSKYVYKEKLLRDLKKLENINKIKLETINLNNGRTSKIELLEE